MEPGHPYLTEELDARRSEQRRLRDVIRGSAALASVARDPVKFEDKPPADPSRAEHQCRLAIDWLLDPYRDLLEWEARSQAALAVGHLVRGLAGGAWIEAASTDLINTLPEMRLPEPDTATSSAEDMKLKRSLRDALVLMELADLFANPAATSADNA